MKNYQLFYKYAFSPNKINIIVEFPEDSMIKYVNVEKIASFRYVVMILIILRKLIN